MVLRSGRTAVRQKPRVVDPLAPVPRSFAAPHLRAKYTRDICLTKADEHQVYARNFRFELDRAECRSIRLQPLFDGARLAGADD